MRKVVVTEFVSLDGVMEDPGGSEDFKHGGWTFKYDRGSDGGKFKFEELMDAEAQLLGRVTYEGFAEAWPGREDEYGFSERMNTMPKYVVTSTLESADWENSTILANGIDSVRELKETDGGSLLVAGSAQLVQGLLANDLVDVLRLMVFPVVLGSGKRLYGDDSPELQAFTLTDLSKVGDDGVTTAVYERAA